MRFKCLAIFPATLLALALISPPAAAEGWEVGFGIGGVDIDDNLQGDSDYIADVRFGYFLTDRFEVEGQALRAPNVFDVRLTAFLVNAVYNFRPDRATIPYLLVGIGTIDVKGGPLYQGSTSDDGFAYQLGVGSRFLVGSGKRFALRLEVSALGEETFGESSVHPRFSGGMTWRFGA